jgi:arylamine N-acetyltransferase
LPPELASGLCSRLGVPWPSGIEDLDALYRAWCATVPFDNVSKALAIAEGRHPPGDDPVAAAELFLSTGLGGTCWTHVTLLTALLTAAGARATVAVDRNLRTDGIIDFHAFVLVHEAGERWMLDTVWTSGRPLPLRDGAVGDHPLVATGVVADEDPDGVGFRHWAHSPHTGTIWYRVLATGLDRGDVRAFCAVSGRFSGVPVDGLRLGRTLPDGRENIALDDGPTDRPVMVVRRRSVTGVETESFPDPDAAFAVLGCTPEARRMAELAGLLRPRAS